MGDYAAPLLGPWTAILSFLAILVLNTIIWLAKRHKVCALLGWDSPGRVQARSMNSWGCCVYQLRTSTNSLSALQAAVTGYRRAQLSAELAFLKREAVKLNTPSTYAKCAKYQRLANSKEKELKELSAPGAVPTVPERLVLLCNSGKVGRVGFRSGRNCWQPR